MYLRGGDNDKTGRVPNPLAEKTEKRQYVREKREFDPYKDDPEFSSLTSHAKMQRLMESRRPNADKKREFSTSMKEVQEKSDYSNERKRNTNILFLAFFFIIFGTWYSLHENVHTKRNRKIRPPANYTATPCFDVNDEEMFAPMKKLSDSTLPLHRLMWGKVVEIESSETLRIIGTSCDEMLPKRVNVRTFFFNVDVPDNTHHKLRQKIAGNITRDFLEEQVLNKIVRIDAYDIERVDDIGTVYSHIYLYDTMKEHIKSEISDKNDNIGKLVVNRKKIYSLNQWLVDEKMGCWRLNRWTPHQWSDHEFDAMNERSKLPAHERKLSSINKHICVSGNQAWD